MNVSSVNCLTNYKNKKSVKFGSDFQTIITPSMLSGNEQGCRIMTSSLKQLRAQLHLSSADFVTYLINFWQKGLYRVI